MIRSDHRVDLGVTGYGRPVQHNLSEGSVLELPTHECQYRPQDWVLGRRLPRRRVEERRQRSVDDVGDDGDGCDEARPTLLWLFWFGRVECRQRIPLNCRI